MRSPVWGPTSFQARLALTLASAAVFALGFAGLHLHSGFQAISLNVVPLFVGAMMFGVRGGVITWALIIPLNLALLTALGLPTPLLEGQNPVRVLVALGIVAVVGRLRDVSLAFEAETVRRVEEFSRRVAESDKREIAEAQLRLTVAAIPDIMLRLARDGTVIDGHAGRRGDLPVPVERLKGQKLFELMPPGFTEQVLPALARTIQTRTPQVVEYRLFRETSEPMDHEVRLVATGLDEALVIVRDVTERKQLDEVLRLREQDRVQARVKERLAAADRHTALGTLAAGVAHEINNPLAYLIINLGFLREELARWRPEGPAPTAAQIEGLQVSMEDAASGAERVRIIVRDLTTFVRADSDATELLDVRAELDFAVTMARTEIALHATLVTELGDVARVKAPSGRMAQVFLNLLLNAAQAIPAGEVADNEVRVVLRMDGMAVVVEVCDTGGGITPEARAHLFEPFFTTKPVGKGTGLGLYVCLNQVTSMGGTIETEPGATKGTVFRVRLPAATEDGTFTFDRVPIKAELASPPNDAVEDR